MTIVECVRLRVMGLIHLGGAARSACFAGPHVVMWFSMSLGLTDTWKAFLVGTPFSLTRNCWWSTHAMPEPFEPQCPIAPSIVWEYGMRASAVVPSAAITI